MTVDTIAFIEAVADGPVDLVGWSDGGVVGLHVALNRPDLVRKLVAIGSNFHHEGTNPAFLDGTAGDEEEADMLRDLYEAVSPDGAPSSSEARYPASTMTNAITHAEQP